MYDLILILFSLLCFVLCPRYGDDLTGTTTTLCVRRATYWDDEMGAEDPAKKGVCSNYLCDASPGTKLKLTGPSGKVMCMKVSIQIGLSYLSS